MKKIVLIIVAGGVAAFIDAQLRVRQQNPTWRAHELACCADRRSAIVPYGAASAEDAVNMLRDRIIEKYDAGIYQADRMMGWQKDRNKALEIQSQLGYTVPDDDSFDPSYDE